MTHIKFNLYSRFNNVYKDLDYSEVLLPEGLY